MKPITDLYKLSNKALKNGTFKTVDFSKISFSNVWIENCSFVDCLFEKSDLSKVQIINSSFVGCEFLKAKMNDASLNNKKPTGVDSGMYINCRFEDSNLSKSTFSFPKIEGCLFDNCNLFQTNFDGSRFKDTIFIGELDSCFFNGYSPYVSNSVFNLKYKLGKRYYNMMNGVDFSKADLFGVKFGYGIDLSNCIMPDDKLSYKVVCNPKESFSSILSKLKSNKDSLYKDLSISYIEKIYFTNSDKDPKTVFIDKRMISEGNPPDFVDYFFKLFDNIE